MNAPPEQKRIIANNLLWNLSIKDQKVFSYQFKKPYDLMVEESQKDDFQKLCALWDYVGTYL